MRFRAAGPQALPGHAPVRETLGSAPTGLSLRANFAWTFAGNVVYAASQWGMLTVLAKLGTPEMVGQFALGSAVAAPVIMLANLQLRAVQATDAQRRHTFGDFLGLRLATATAAFVAVAVVAFAAGYRRETAVVIIVIGAVKTAESISDVLFGLLQQRERLDLIARSLIIKGPASLLALGLAVLATGSVGWGVAALALVSVLVLVLYDRRNAESILQAESTTGCRAPNSGEMPLLRPHWEPHRLLSLAWLALPLGIVMMLISLSSGIPRYFVEGSLGERELGFFAAMAYLQAAGTTVVSALGHSASPRLAIHYAAGNYRAFRWLLVRLVCIGVVMGAGGVLVALVLGRQLLTILYQPEYASQPAVLTWLMAASGVGYVAAFLGYGMTATRSFWPQLPLFALVVLVVTIGCSVLVPEHGLVGAAIAMLFSALVQAIGSGTVVAHALRRRAGWASIH